jgi:hypothetical protein
LRVRTLPPIDRIPRGTYEYEPKVSLLSPLERQRLELAEEHVLADHRRTHGRRSMPDGTTFDMSAYDDFDVLLAFRDRADGTPEFVDFRIYEPG